MAGDLDPPTHPEDPRDRFLVLVVRYFDGNLDETETAELNALLRADPECRRQFAEYGTRGRLIRETFDPERQGSGLQPTSRGPGAGDTRPPAARPARTMGRRRVLLVAGIAGLAATVAFLFWLPSRPPAGAKVLGSVEPASGDVRIITPDGEVRVVGERAELHTGDTVRTGPLQGSAAVVYPDGTRITLVGDTIVTCSGEGRKNVVVHQGMVGVSVSPQPEGSPMVLATPAARIVVRGTEFYCQALPDRTDVSVTRGSVQVVRASDGRAVEVSEGKRVLAEGRAEFAVEDILQPPDTLDLDFENGLPAGFHKGRFVADDLPRGSKGGVAAVRSDHGEDGIFYEIATSPDMWYRGLFAIHADTHVHFTFKRERPGWINVFVQARSREPTGSHTGNYLFNELLRPPPGKWRTATIPLSEFRRAGSGKGPPPSPDEMAYRVFFSSDGDRGLVIDRVWVTRGGPGVIRYEDVE